MPELPNGTVTFLCAEIEEDAGLWEQRPDAMRAIIARHDALLRKAVETHQGYIFRTIGDASCAVFATPFQAVAAALAAQQAAFQEKDGASRLRIALHAGDAQMQNGDYFGPALSRTVRLAAIGHAGQTLLSGAARDLLGDVFPSNVSLRDLGRHRLRDLQQPEHVYQLLHPDLPPHFPSLRSLQATANNLPQQITSFVGREKELEDIRRLLPHTRLLTLTGSGGCGKTRLSLQAAVEMLESYADGVWLVELAPLTDPALVAQSIILALGVREEPGRPPLDTLTDYLRSRSLLLLLDNCEHLIEACAQIAEHLLKTCPRLRILASSREALGIAGETAWRVPSLALPEGGSAGLNASESPASLLHYEAVRLFVERARAAVPEFALTPENALLVAQICQRLDGIPLAIELAAARIRSLSVEQLAQRLVDRFRLLTGGSRTALPRQQTLRAAIDWSYNLLSPQEQTLLRRLSVFVGGWTLEAAEAICKDDEEAGVSSGVAPTAILEEWEVFDLLSKLVDKSLVLVEEDSGRAARYRLLETVRQYSRDRLLESGEGEGLRDRHRDWFLQFAETAESQLVGTEQAAWLEKLETEHDNLRAGLEWCSSPTDGDEKALRMAGALWRFWEVRGYLNEGRAHLTDALTMPGARLPTVARAKALGGAGHLTQDQGDFGAARLLHEEALDIYQKVGDRSGIANALNNLGILAWGQGDLKAARELFEQGLNLRRKLQDVRGIAVGLANLANVARDEGDRALAQSLLEQSAALRRELHDDWGIANVLNNLGILATEQKAYDKAVQLFQESLALRQQLGDKGGIAAALGSLAVVACRQANYGEAETLLCDSLRLMRELGDRRGMAACLEQMAEAVGAQGQTERAACLFGAAEALRERIHAPLPSYEREEYDHAVAVVRQSAEDEAFAANWQRGRSLSLDEALAQALGNTGNV